MKKRIINTIVRNGNCNTISSDDCAEYCLLYTICSSEMSKGTPFAEFEKIIYRVACKIKENNYKLSNHIIFDEVL